MISGVRRQFFQAKNERLGVQIIDRADADSFAHAGNLIWNLARRSLAEFLYSRRRRGPTL